jgi:hypothetical protein
MHHTRILSLESVVPTIYTTLPPSWLSTVLTNLPQLRVLSVKDFPFFDHLSLTNIATLPTPHQHLRTLLAPHLHNSTATGLATLLHKLPHLRTLDLSCSTGANHPATLQAIAQLPLLTTLSLRSLNLDSATLSPLLKACGTSLRSLDLRENLLTDSTAYTLLDYTFLPPSYLTSMPMEEGGLTHLRIAGNRFSEDGVLALIKSARLQTLDTDVAGVTAVLSLYAHETMRTLRVPCAVVMRNGLRRGMVPALKRLVLTGVPEWAPRREVEALVAFIAEEGEGGLEVLELEMGNGEMEGSQLEGEFSFFGEDEGSAWMGETQGEERMETLKEIKKVRDRKTGWRGRIRVLPFGTQAELLLRDEL